MVQAGYRLPAAVFCLALAATAASRTASADEGLRAALELRNKYAADMEKLAAWCEERGLTDEARKTRFVLGPADPHKLYVPVLPKAAGQPALPAGAPAEAGEWDARLWRLRRDYAAAAFDMARRAVRNGRAGLAIELALASIRANPDYEPVRRLFGYQKHGGQWRTTYEVRKLRSGNVWSDRFGWLPKGRLRRYENGERYFAGKWISAAEDAERRRDIQSGWDVETEHYSIRTNHGIEAAVAMGVKLERLRQLWGQLFLRYHASQSDVEALFDGRLKPEADAPRLGIVLFRDREEYNRHFRAAMPNIGISTGVYVERTRRAYFFTGPECDDRTIYHEAAHQLFHQSRPVAPEVGKSTNFWIVEGIAMFMESLREEDGFYVLGGFDDDRVRAARHRLLNDKFYVSLDDLVGYGMGRLQQDPRIARLYSQSAGLTNFLIFYDGGRYRDAVVAYLLAVYTGRDDRDTLSRLTGAAYAELDEQYVEYMKGGEEKN